MDVLGDGLSWSARIDVEKLEADGRKIQEVLDRTAAAAGKTQIAPNLSFRNIDADLNKIQSSSEKLGTTLETLRGKLLARQDFLLKETDVSRIAKYNKEIEQLAAEITRVQNIGKRGFDELGNPLKAQEGLLQRLQRQATLYKKAIQEATLPENVSKYNTKLEQTNDQMKRLQNAGKNGFDNFGNALKNVTAVGEAAEKTATRTNILSKSFGFLKTAAALLPGIGLVGILGLISEGVVSLVKDLVSGGKAFDEFKSRYNNLSKALDSGGFKEAVKDVSELRIQVDLAKRGFIDKKDVVEQYNRTMGQTTGQVKSLEGVEKQLAENAPAYIRMTLLKAAANVSLQEAAEKAVAAEKNRQKNLKDFANAPTDTRVSSGGAGGLGTGQFNAAEYDRETNRIAAARQKRKDKQIKIETDAQKQQEDIANKFLNDAAKLSKDFKFDFAGDAASDLKTYTQEQAKAQVIENKTNDILQKRKDLLAQINEVKSDADNGTLIEERGEIEKINDRYDLLIKKVDEYNRQANRFNSQTKGAGVPVIGNADKATINQAKQIEISNAIQKQEAENYKRSVEQKKIVFDDFEAYRLQVGRDNADRIFLSETDGVENYVDFLQKELAKLSSDNSNGGKLKRFFVTRELETALAEQRQTEVREQTKTYADLLNLTAGYEAKRLFIFEKYGKLRAALEKQRGAMGEDEYSRRSSALTQGRNEEVAALDSTLVTQSVLYKKFNQDLLQMSRDRIKDEIKELKSQLKKGVFVNSEGKEQAISPAFRKQVESYIDQLEKLYKESDTLAGFSIAKVTELANKFGEIGSILTGLGNDLSGVSGKVSGLLTTMGSLAGEIQAGLQAGAQIAQQDVAGGVTTIVSSIIKTFADSKRSQVEAAKQLAEFQTRLLAGEIDITQEYRERARIEAAKNKSTLAALEQQRRLLQAQKVEVQGQADALLRQIQQQQYISGQKTEKQGGSGALGAVGALFGFGKKTVVVNEYASLLGKTFSEIEALYRKNQLDEKAKALFEQLQKLQQEGVNISEQLDQLKEKASEVFTGTTADAITDMIVQGFGDGLRTVQDFGDKTEDIVRGAMLNALKYQFLQEPIKKLYEQLAKDAESGGGLDVGEIANFTNSINKTITDAAKFTEQIEKATGISLAKASGAANTLAGSIKASITEETGTIVAGTLNGIRLINLEALAVARVQLQAQLNIENNTALTVTRLEQMTEKMSNWFTVTGIKIR